MPVHSMDEILFNMFIVKEFYILVCGDEEVMGGGDLWLVQKMIMMNMATPMKMEFSDAKF